MPFETPPGENREVDVLLIRARQLDLKPGKSGVPAVAVCRVEGKIYMGEAVSPPPHHPAGPIGLSC
jgi:hypothetical protein